MKLPYKEKSVNFANLENLLFTYNHFPVLGQTLRMAGLHLEEPCFAHGQLYVAASQVGSGKNLFVLAEDGKTKNIVYPQALR